VIDSYVQGNDLVITYALPAPHAACLELRWRALFPAQSRCLMLDLQLSANTARPVTVPNLDVLTWIRGESHPISSGILSSLVGGSSSLLIMAHPSDFCGSAIEDFDDVKRLKLRVFDEPLEKGVIRRARLRAMVTEYPIDEQSAITFQQSFQS